MNLRRAGWEALVMGLILLAGAALRLYGLNWDDGHWLHPDERQIYFVTIDLGWPESLAEALSPDSPLNPGFFAYGSFPFYLLKLVTALLTPLWPTLRDPDNLHLVGRPLAALFDLGPVFLTFRLARCLLRTSHPKGRLRGGALWPAALACLAVLHVQLAHFYATDPLLTFFVMLILNLAAGVTGGAGRRRQVALGISLGLAMATKTTAALLVVPIFAACLAQHAKHKAQSACRNSWLTMRQNALLAAIRCLAPTLVLAALVFVVVQPYALIDWRTFVGDTVRESQIAWGWLDVPYTRQYAGTLPYLYSMWQTALWGMALPLGVVAWIAFGAALVGWLRRGIWADALLLAWAGPYLTITGLLYTRYLRYLLPLVPILCLLVAQFLSSRRHRRASATEPSSVVLPPSSAFAVLILLVLVSSVYALCFAAIYNKPHSWITASEWVYRQAPAGSTLAVEEWDTALPLPLDVDGRPRRIEEYAVHTLPLYREPDDAAKWGAIAADLADSDYLVIASRRLYGSITRQPDRYPLTTRYYEQLFAGELGFDLVGEFTRGPAWLNPRLSPLPDAIPRPLQPDESFVVYDHPRALVYRNVRRLTGDELLHRLR